jgi:capsular exopolysaccharide synthesis family protein
MTRLAEALERAKATSRVEKRRTIHELKFVPPKHVSDAEPEPTFEPERTLGRTSDAMDPESRFGATEGSVAPTNETVPPTPEGIGPAKEAVAPTKEEITAATEEVASPADELASATEDIASARKDVTQAKEYAAVALKAVKPAGPVPLLRVPANAPADMPVHTAPALAGKLIGTAGVPFGCTEQYRKLGATLHHVQMERGIKVLMVSSAVAGEGKTLTATNIALTLSESYGRKVLIVDADLRRPTLHQVFNLPNLTGLSDALRSQRDRTLSLTRVASRLSVLTAGRPDPDPMSGLTSPRLRRIVQEATTVFDWVIIDTPPAGLLPDAKLIAALAEAAVLVVRSGRAPFQLVKQAIEALGRDRIVGTVLNGVDPRTSAAAPYYGYGYYTYGGHDQPTRSTGT